MKKINILMISILSSLLLLACGGETKKQSDAPMEEAPVAAQAPADAEVPTSVSLVIEGNDAMQYNLKELNVIEGQSVTLTLKHVGKMAKDVMGHNWVLLKPGTDIPSFGAAAMKAKDTDYIPQDLLDKVIANTKTIGGGEEVSITFDAPKRGYYKFICSFPGHYGVMQGTFTVQPK